MNVEASCKIQAPKDRVFATFTDLANLANHVEAIKAIDVLTPGEIGVGTEFKETRVMFGKEATETMRITEFSPPDRLVEEARSNGMHYVSIWTFSEVDGETTVTFKFSGRATTLMSRILSVLFSYMAGSMRKAILTDMNDLKRVLED